MNKVLSQAIKKAVSEFSPVTQENNLEKRPDLFSLNNETELFQNSKGITIKIPQTFYIIKITMYLLIIMYLLNNLLTTIYRIIINITD